MSIFYEGYVRERSADVVSVTLLELATDQEYYAEIDLGKFPEEDRPLCEPGALFTISVSDATAAVALRRDVWTQDEIDAIKLEAEREWRDFAEIVE